jgi:hypothetical protein
MCEICNGLNRRARSSAYGREAGPAPYSPPADRQQPTPQKLAFGMVLRGQATLGK